MNEHLCPHGQNRTACLTCYRRNQETEKEARVVRAQARAQANPLGTSAVREVKAVFQAGPPPRDPGAFATDKLWEPPVHPEVSSRQSPRRG